MYKISVIIPVYNVANYIVRCIESVIKQDTEKVQIECILIDDCSPDDSIEIAKKFLDSYEGSVRFLFIYHEKNLGQSAARNNGIRSASGDYLFFLDSDDRLETDAFSKMVNELERCPYADIIEGYYIYMKDGNIYPGKPRPLFLYGKQEILDKLYMNKVSALACNKLINRKLIIDNSLFFVEGIIYEDIQWTNRLYHCISSVIIIPYITYIYEYNPSSTSNSSIRNATNAVNSFSTVICSFLDCETDIVYVSHKFFIFHYILMAMDIQKRGHVDEQAIARLSTVKKRLLYKVIKDGRLILSIFFLLMFRPFSFLFNYSFFRHHIHEMEHGVAFIAKKMDWIHSLC